MTYCDLSLPIIICADLIWPVPTNPVLNRAKSVCLYVCLFVKFKFRKLLTKLKILQSRMWPLLSSNVHVIFLLEVEGGGQMILEKMLKRLHLQRHLLQLYTIATVYYLNCIVLQLYTDATEYCNNCILLIQHVHSCNCKLL